MENLMSVMALDKKWVNGFRTINSAATDIGGKTIKLLMCKVLSTKEESFISQAELKKQQKSLKDFGEEYFNQISLIKEQIMKTDSAFKEAGINSIIHILDKGFDINEIFNFIVKEVKSDFIIRLKTSRNSNADVINPKTNRKNKEKLVNKSFNQSYKMEFEK